MNSPQGLAKINQIALSSTKVSNDEPKKLSNRSLQMLKWTPDKVTLLQALITVKGKRIYIKDGEGRQRQIVLPGEEDGVLKEVFEDLPPNMGIQKAYPYITERYTGITRDKVFDFMRKNKYYQQFHQRRNASHSKAIISENPGKRWQVDYFYMPQSVPHEGRSYKGALMIVDTYTKLVQIKPIWGDEDSKKDAAAMTEFLDGPYGGRVKIVQTDNGSSFKTGPFHDLLVERGIAHMTSSTSTPQSQGVAERANQTAKRWLYAMSKEKYGNEATKNDGRTSWVKVVPLVEKAMNQTIQMTTKKTPLQLWEEGDTNETVVNRLKQAAAKRYYSRVYKEAPLKPGDKVILSMGISANAPFHVKDAIANKSYKIYKQQWDTTKQYTIERAWGDTGYRLVEAAGNYDRTQLLKVPGQ